MVCGCAGGRNRERTEKENIEKVGNFREGISNDNRKNIIEICETYGL